MLIGLLYNPQTRNSSTLNPTPSYRSICFCILATRFQFPLGFSNAQTKNTGVSLVWHLWFVSKEEDHGGSVEYLLTPNCVIIFSYCCQGG
jgi:hypothetical protein